jgi:hypothetical protein
MQTKKMTAIAARNGTDKVLGAYLFPSRADVDNKMGHMWISWTEEINVPNRGYWPDFSQIPATVRRSGNYRDFFINNRVPGRYVDESLNPITIGIRELAGSTIRNRSWSIGEQVRTRLGLRCVIPPDKDGVDEGFYSCEEERENCENCSSWALKVMRDAKCDPGFLPCRRPKRLSFVEIAIWGE